MIIVLNDYLVHSCWGLHLGSRFLTKQRLLECSWARAFSFALRIVTKLLCFCLCLLDDVVDLYATDEK